LGVVRLFSFVCFAVLGSAVLGAEGIGITNQPSPAPEQGEGRRAVVGAAPQSRHLAGPEPRPLPPDTGWVLVDSLSLHSLIPAGMRVAVVFDSVTGTLRDTLLPEFLTELAHQAVALAPTWLQDDLLDNFRRLSQTQQDAFARLIINCPDKRYYDELCFQVAHLSPVAFLNLPPRLLLDNVQFAYQIDRELGYVDIIDYGDPLRGGDYYSTTRYRAIVNGDTALVEVPRDVYYWWVIMPKVTDEPPTYVYNRFWRDYLFYYCDSGYPLLREKLANTRVLWNGERGWWQGNGGPWFDSLPAVAVVGRWCAYTVPRAAQGNRPIQPNQIAHEHDGNCGEMQDLLCAAARAALIPCGGVMDINEDHVWNDIWWQDSMHPWQVDLGGGPTNIKNPGVAYDRKYGGSKQVSGVWDWRNDGRQRSVVGTYSDVCTLTVDVFDPVGRPVDGAVVKFSSEFWYGGIYDCFYGLTDRSGRYTTTLGDWQNYYFAVTSPLGGRAAGRIIDSVNCAPGTHFFYACTLAGRRDSLVVVPDSAAPADRYRLDVSFSAGREAYYGQDCYNANGANEYILVSGSGAIDCFIADEAGFGEYLAGGPFDAYASDEDAGSGSHSLVLPDCGRFYAVLSNEEQVNLSVLVDVNAKLYRRGTGVEEVANGVRRGANGPTVVRGVLNLSSTFDCRFPIALRDISGRNVMPLRPGANDVSRLPAGVYFLCPGKRGQSTTGQSLVSRKVVVPR
jgi:hypothetical protein